MSRDAHAKSPAAAEHRFASFLARRFVRARGSGLVSLISLISALGFLLGVASLIIVLALMTGFHQETFRHILDANAHVWVVSAARPGLSDAERLIESVEGVAGVTGAEPVIQGFGVVIPRGGRFRPAELHGVDPVRSHRASLLPESVVEGRFEEIAARPGARPGIALGAVLAQQLGVGLGDPVQVRVMVPELAFSEVPSLRGRSFEVVAVFRAGFEEFDAGWALIDRQVAQDLFRLEQPAERIAIRTASVDQVPAVSEALRRELGADYVVSDIYDQFEELFAALRLEKLLLFIAVGLIVLVAAFGVVSTLVLTVTQKIRSIGVLAAIGVAPSGLIRVFVYQGMAMGVLGTIGGAALGVVAAWLLDRLELIPLDPRVYLLDHLPFHLIWSDVAATVVMALLLSAGATLYPAWRVSRLDPVEALRHD